MALPQMTPEFIRMALACDITGYEPPAEVVTFPHLRRQIDATVKRHALLATEYRDEEYAKACRAELERRYNERNAA